MKRRLSAGIASLALVGVLGAAFAGGVGAKTDRILQFEVMTPVVAPYTGATNPLRGLNGGGVPWVIHSGRGWLTAGGHVKIDIQGLVLAASGSNPIASFKGVVSCQTVTDGLATVANVSTDAFTATTGLATAGGGDAEIDAQVSLPHPCIAPIIFVTSVGSSWFASTGF
jgi:hypothetical protein